MNWDKSLGGLLLLQIAMLIAVMGSLFMVSEPSNYKLYEIFGALSASILTVFGLKEMRKLTSE